MNNGVFHVIARAIDPANEIVNRERLLDEGTTFRDPTICGVDIMGRRHDNDQPCENWEEDDFGSGCMIEGYTRSKQEIDILKWTPAMLDYYWQSGIGKNGFEFLDSSGFVLSYE